MLTCHPHPLFTVKFLAEFQTVQVQGTHFEITSQHRLLEMTMHGLYCLNPDFNTLAALGSYSRFVCSVQNNSAVQNTSAFYKIIYKNP